MGKVVLAPQKGAQEVAMQSQASLIIYGGAAGSGKSHILLMHPGQYLDDPNFNGVFFRRVTKQLTGPGGLWSESTKMYQPFGIKSAQKPDMIHKFPPGSTLSFCHMEHEKHRHGHQGLQYSFIGFDELTHFEEVQFTYLLSRLRSDADSNSYCLCTCNPDADSWVLKWVDWWLDEEGYPDKAKQGKIRYYIVAEDSPIFADTAEELMEEYPDLCRHWDDEDEVWIEVRPKTMTFIGGTILDNRIMIKKNPGYLADLKALPKIERARLLDGNWYIKAEGSKVWDSAWVRGEKGERVRSYEDIPQDIQWYRGWDKGYSTPSDKNKSPDFTAGSPKIGKDNDGMYWLVGDYHDDTFDIKQAKLDHKNRQLGRFRELSGKRDSLIIKQAKMDGPDCKVVLTRDTAAGATDHTFTMSRLHEEGILAVEDKSPKNTPGKKFIDFQPFANACMIGLVYIVESSFSPATLKAIYKELEKFDPEKKSNSTRKDDWIDAFSLAFAQAYLKKVFKLAPRNQTRHPTHAAKILGRSTHTKPPGLPSGTF